MKVSIELALTTREVYQLFERKISGDRLFIAAILHKFNIVINRCRQRDLLALAIYSQMEQKIIKLSQQVTDEIANFETMLAKKKDFSGAKVSYVTKFRPAIIVTNPLAMQLIKFIGIYDKLISTLKLLQLAGCFESDDVFWGNIRRCQKITNQMLSDLVLTPTTAV
jgi:hypothetical protein